ncbi:MAG TPA: pilus assembly protein TadG-related protein [Acidimicrobiales bacterium]|nr:pilus assembly protein TadG-related protein [Acidimicrobiales bacterium]
MTIRARLRRNLRNEHGAILVMAVPGLVLAVLAMSLSIDVGRQVFEKRDDQSVADLAALDAARSLAAVPAPSNPSAAAQSAAEKSAVRNGFDLAEAGSALTTEVGWVDPSRVFHLAGASDAVRVTVTSNMDYIFIPGKKTLRAVAVATVEGGLISTVTTTTTTTPTTTASTTSTTLATTPVPWAGFTLGSTLASIDTTKAPLLNAVLGGMLRGAASGGGTANLVSWQGLATSNITLEALRGQLELLQAGTQFGTIDQMLAADITLAQLATATANALTASGDTNAALYSGPLGIIAQSTNTATFNLGDLFDVASGVGGSALSTKVNAFQLLTGSATVANGTNLVSVPNIGITVPSVGTTGLTLKVIEGQKIYIGPAATSGVAATVSTGQIDLTLTSNLDIPITVSGLTNARLVGTFPVSLTAAGATGTLASIACPPVSGSGGSIGVGVDLKAVGETSTSALGVSASVLGLPVTLFSVATTATASTDPAPASLSFAYPSEFSPSATGKQVGSAPLGLAGMTTFTSSATALGVVTVPTGLVPAVTSTLSTVLGNLDSSVLAPLLRTLGVSIGAADVAALKDALVSGCANPIVPTVVTTTTTAPPAPTTTTSTPAAATTSSTLQPRPRLVG